MMLKTSGGERSVGNGKRNHNDTWHYKHHMPEDNDAMSQSSEETFFQHTILYSGKFLTRLEEEKKDILHRQKVRKFNNYTNFWKQIKAT